MVPDPPRGRRGGKSLGAPTRWVLLLGFAVFVAPSARSAAQSRLVVQPPQLAPGLWRELWVSQRGPLVGVPESFGTTTSGCLAGAVALPARGEGFVARRLGRTYYGHPDLVDYVRQLGRSARAVGLGSLVIGDLSLPRGGVFPTRHRSHQSGLDVDIAYRPVGKSLAFLNPHDESELPIPGMKRALTEASPKRIEAILKLAADDKRVDRIFVNARIKRILCDSASGDLSWLRKLRPWWGHERHFHVRLRCPEGSLGCRPNPPVPLIEECGPELDWWFTPEARETLARRRMLDRLTRGRDLPAQCLDIVDLRGGLLRGRRAAPAVEYPTARTGRRGRKPAPKSNALSQG